MSGSRGVRSDRLLGRASATLTNLRAAMGGVVQKGRRSACVETWCSWRGFGSKPTKKGTKKTVKRDDVSLHPLSPEEALRGFMQSDPDKVKEAEKREREKKEKANE